MYRSPGFTLIETMVVLLILAILAAIAYPGYTEHLATMRRIEGQVALIDAMQQQERHHALHHSYVAFSAAAPVEGQRWWSGNHAPESAYELEARACPDSALRDCVEIVATPGTPNVDASYRDSACGTLSMRSTGEQGASGTSSRCWP